jgi:hypothetical protein
LANSQEYRVGLIRDLNENEGFAGFQGTPRVVGKTIVIDQLIDGIPFIDPEAGHLEITFDARTGQAKRARSTLRAFTSSLDNSAVSSAHRSIEEAREVALKTFATPTKPGGLQESLEVVPGTEAVGYHLIDGNAVPVYRVLVKNPNFTLGRPQQVIIPLLKVK